jgi:uncharacterized integral membrane protein
MSAKTIFIVILTVLVTVILMKNMDEVNFWIFGDYSIPKLAVLGTMFVIGVVVGLLIGRGRKKPVVVRDESLNTATPYQAPTNLSEEDENYIR